MHTGCTFSPLKVTFAEAALKFCIQFAYLTAIHGISPFGAKFLYVKMMSTLTDFLVRKSNPHFTMLDLGMCDQIPIAVTISAIPALSSAPKSVYRQKQYILTFVLQNFRKKKFQELFVLFVQQNILPVIIFDYA